MDSGIHFLKNFRLKPFFLCVVGIVFIEAVFLISCHEGNKRDASTPQVEEMFFKRFLDSLSLNASANDKSNEIRKYLAFRLNRGKPGDSISVSIGNMPLDSIPLFQCLSLLRAGNLSGNCRLSSFLLAQMYRHAGLTSVVYNCGFEGTRFTHQFNLVEADGRWIIQDAHYNITLVSHDGTPKDFFQMLAEIRQGNFSDIVIKDGGLKKSGRHTNFESIAKRRLKAMKPLLRREGLPENFFSLYLIPLHIIDSNGEKAAEVNERILSITQQQ